MTWLSQAAPWLALLAVVPLMYLLSLGLTALNCRRLRLRAAPLAVVERQALAPPSRSVLDAMQPELNALGFHWCASLQGRHPYAMEPDLPLELDLYQHAEGQAWALAQPEQSESARHGRSVGSVTWFSFFADGSNWIGLNGKSPTALPVPPGWTYVDEAQPDTASAWAAYARRLAGAGAPVVHGLEQAVQRLDALGRGQPEALQARGQARPAGPGCWRLTWRASLGLAWRALRQMQKENKTGAAPPAGVPGPEASSARQWSEALRFAYQKALQRGLGAAHNRHRSFWVTALLFLATGALLFSWDLAWMLLLVIAVHEGGHWLAMRWAGYQRQSVFFIPGLGGMATGEKADATPLQRVGVYLAGPMPGLLLAVGTLAAAGSGLVAMPPEWVMRLLQLTLFINAFNLLPLTPLDGGRVVEALLFTRLPVLRLVFALAGMAGLGALAWFSRDPVIAAIAGVLLMGLPWQWRVMRLERAMHRCLRPEDGRATGAANAPVTEEEAVRRLFGVLQQPAFARWPFVRRAAAAGALLPSLQSRAPGWAEGAAGLLIYLACLVLPVAGIVGIYQAAPQGRQAFAALLDAELKPDRAYTPETHMESIEERLAQDTRESVADAEQRMQPQLDAAEELLSIDDHAPAIERAQALYQSAWAATQARPPHDLQRAQALKGMADAATAADAPEQAAQWLQQLVVDLQGARGPARLILASAQEHLASYPLPGSAMPQRLQWMAQAVDNRRAESDGRFDYALVHARERLGRLLDASGHPGAAQAQLHANVLALQAAQPRNFSLDSQEYEAWKISLLVQAETLYARFLAEHAQADAALALVRSSAARTLPGQADHYAIRQARLAWLWVAMEAGDAMAVRQALAAQGPARQGRAETDRAQAMLAAAQMLDDEALRTQALARLQQLPQARRGALCRSPQARSDIQLDWRDLERRRWQAAARAAGLCEAS